MPRALRASATLALLASTLVATPSTAHARLVDGVTRDPSAVVRHQAPLSVASIVAAREALPPVVATIGDVELRSPGRRVAVAAFHEGSTRSLELAPVGHDTSAGPFAPTTHAEHGPVAVLPSRGRAAPATSAIDLPVPEGEALTSPVTGTVVGVSTYSLYGATTDWLLEVRPTSDPDVIVRIFHVVSPSFTVGQEVVAGATPMAASARVLPFPSQVDRLTTTPLPHVHVQVDSA